MNIYVQAGRNSWRKVLRLMSDKNVSTRLGKKKMWQSWFGCVQRDSKYVRGRTLRVELSGRRPRG